MSKETPQIIPETTQEQKTVLFPAFDIRFVMQRRRTGPKRMAETSASHSRRKIIRNRGALRK